MDTSTTIGLVVLAIIAVLIFRFVARIFIKLVLIFVIIVLALIMFFSNGGFPA